MFIQYLAATMLAITAPPALQEQSPEEWLSREIDNAMFYPYQFKDVGVRGVATVTFDIDEDKKPENLKVSASSGYAILDKAAIRVVSSLPTFPSHFPAGKHAVVLKWDTVEETERHSLKKAMDEKVDLARAEINSASRRPVRSVAIGKAALPVNQ